MSHPKSHDKISASTSLFRLSGWVSFLVAALLTGCSLVQGANQPASPAATSPEVASAPTATTQPAAAPAVTEPDPEGEEAATEANSAGDSLPQPEFAAQIGKITFAPETTDQHEPVNPSLLFSQGITEVHALFDYSGMSPAYTWERVWLLNDKEVARKTGIWAGPESGVFDYFIDNGGRPLPPGDWVLEIYVEGKLLSLGAFVIENPEEAQANNQ